MEPCPLISPMSDPLSSNVKVQDSYDLCELELFKELRESVSNLMTINPLDHLVANMQHVIEEPMPIQQQFLLANQWPFALSVGSYRA